MPETPTIERRVPGSAGRTLRKVEFSATYDEGNDQDCPVVPIDEANVVTSEAEYLPGWHYPVLDIDFPCELVPSTTPGHFHLYLDRAIQWPDYEALLDALADAQIIERGYAEAAMRRQRTDVRLPWISKPGPETNPTTEGDPIL